MRFRIYLLFVTTFFVAMNVLLWRAEFGSKGRSGTPVPAGSIWEKVLTCPDNSDLEIRHKGVKIGRGRWVPAIGEAAATGKHISEEPPPEGMIRRPTSYSLDLDGTISLPHLPQLGYDLQLRLDTNQNWQEFHIKLKSKLKPNTNEWRWEIHASAQTQRLRLFTKDDGEQEQSFAFADLQSPERIAGLLGGPAFPALLAGLGWPLAQARPSQVALGLKWEARNDWIKIGRNQIRVYRLEARLFDRFRATFFVSSVGEILRLELPDYVVLLNEALLNL